MKAGALTTRLFSLWAGPTPGKGEADLHPGQGEMETGFCVQGLPLLPLLSRRSPELFLMWGSSLHQPMLLGNLSQTGSALAPNFFKNSVCFHVGGKFRLRVGCPYPAEPCPAQPSPPLTDTDPTGAAGLCPTRFPCKSPAHGSRGVYKYGSCLQGKAPFQRGRFFLRSTTQRCWSYFCLCIAALCMG